MKYFQLLTLLGTLFLLQCSPSILQVHKEPMHQPVFKSKKVRIMDVRFPPGDTCQYHQHSENYFYVAVKGGLCFVQNKGEEGRVLDLLDGYAGGKFNMPTDQFTHRIANMDQDTIQYIAIENLKPENTVLSNFKPSFNEQLLDDNTIFRAIRMEMPGLDEQEFLSDVPMLIVNQNEVPYSIDSIEEPKTWKWISEGKNILIKNTSEKTLVLTMIQVK